MIVIIWSNKGLAMATSTRMKYLKSGHLAEESIHRLTMEYIECHPRLNPYRKFILHFANEGKRSKSYGLLMRKLGMRKGASDLFIAVPRHTFGGAWIELKSSGGTVSPAQKEFLVDMCAQNFYTRVCWSLDESIKVIEWYLLK